MCRLWAASASWLLGLTLLPVQVTFSSNNAFALSYNEGDERMPMPGYAQPETTVGFFVWSVATDWARLIPAQDVHAWVW